MKKDKLIYGKFLLSAVLLQLLTSCAGSYEKHLPGFTTVTINQIIDFPAGKTRRFIQNGRIVDGFDHYHPNCNLEIRIKDADNQQSVQPGSYSVTGIRQTYENVVKRPYFEETRLASVGVGFGISFGNVHFATGGFNDSPSYVYRGYHFNLDGPDPNVMRISCRGIYAAPADAILPTENEMIAAFGSLISLHR
jgi:hypothetical protein